MTLMSELGIVPEDFIWQDLALCAGLDTELFFDKYEGSSEIAKQMDICCLSCPVLKECFTMGYGGQHGLYGGVYFNGAGKPDKNKNSHKTDAVWSEIYRRVSK